MTPGNIMVVGALRKQASIITAFVHAETPTIV